MKKSYPLLRYFADHPTAANLLMLLFLFLGVTTAADLKRETFPEFDSSMVEISVAYPGASAEDVENAICLRIEDALDGITQVEEVISEAREGVGRVTVEMVEGGDISQFLADIRSEIDTIDDFPDAAEDPVVGELNRTDLVLSVAVTGPMSVPDLKLYSEQLKDRIMALPEVSEVKVQGFSDHQIRIEIPAGTLMKFGLSVSDVADRIARMSVDLPAGSVQTREADILVRMDEERRNVHEYEDLIVISGRTGAEIRLGDIATISDSFELDEDKIIFNGQRAAILQVNKVKADDTLDVMHAVYGFLDRERLAAPPTVTFTVTRNISKIVQDRLDLLTMNGVQGLILVFLTLWLFFAFRFSFWVSMGLPVSFMGAVFAMQIFGLSLNLLSMVGLLLALGLIMDDAIVIAENVAAHLKMGKNALDAAVEGTAQVARGVASSFATTVLIFGTIALLLEGSIGKILWAMPVVLILTLMASLIEAFFILPNHLAHSLAGYQDNGKNRFRRRFEQRLEAFREDRLGRAVDWCVRWRYLWVGCVLAVFLLSVGMIAGGHLKTRAFPEIDGDVVEARILLPQGTPLARTEQIAAHVAQAATAVGENLNDRQPEGRDLVENVNIQFGMNSDANESGAHLATVSIDLLDAERRDATIDEFNSLWRKGVGQVADVISISYTEPAIGPAGRAIDIRLQGHDLDNLKLASLELQDWLNGYRGVLDLKDDLRPGKPEVRVRMREGAMALGLDAASIARQLRAALHGVDAAEIQAGPESYEINVRLARMDRDSMADLEYFHLTAPDGSQVPLGAVAELVEGRGWARIGRIDSLRTVSIQGDVDTSLSNVGEIISETQAQFVPELLKRYPDVTVSLEGEAREGAKTGASLRKALMIGLFGIFVLLSFQFKSYAEPLVVISAIPMALIGVIWGHLIMGQDLAMPSIMGFVSLAGIVVNDSILLVEFIKIRMREEGLSASDAARMASRGRFRAVLLTSMTTIMGLIPLMFERSLQAQVLIPLAVSIIFGLLASTVLVLLVIPALYAILDDFGLISKSVLQDRD
ncbi:efflux RND transporter permease subunit [Desulfovibrio ferrophilus]|uniref:Cation/multidrug efflux pump n=1 Tax=Desulfovibrio ferrophilus TaxID=241368 RepID=A0A2Z6AZR9_9BACT|nr:efflux RND transporter permease subunit [Desulfovibrio ferrophilus]BBD08767.1 cation/multidrug efflux pump [Desulfovibrio ferrophilus]